MFTFNDSNMEYFKAITVLFTWVLFIIAMVYYNFILIRLNFIVNHMKNAIITSVLSLALSFLIYSNFINFIFTSLTLLFIYWIFFDIGLNLKRGLPTSYIGRKSKLDIFLRKYAYGYNITFKVTAFILISIIYGLIR